MSGTIDEATQKELTTFMEAQEAQSRLYKQIHKYTGLCWDKCIPGAPGSQLSNGEQNCVINCVNRFVDTSMFLMKKVESQRDQATFQ
ncbi:hypothetical protein OBBRIDRAFT_765413 [Obba rivulosa]|uniref:Mitochondrial import inner membrane translocase subunit n=1 Tax=Obba rivulosa TaxID=1052685 RepID=A0A8E2J776_9APHY|nr:hypothetical protein OBBRIDRAFT_765413 [Obba rivulosa]